MTMSQQHGELEYHVPHHERDHFRFCDKILCLMFGNTSISRTRAVIADFSMNSRLLSRAGLIRKAAVANYMQGC
jgi:hypothetical protein